MQIISFPPPVVSSTPDLRKRPRKLKVSLQDTAAKKPEVMDQRLHKGRGMGGGPNEEEPPETKA